MYRRKGQDEPNCAIFSGGRNCISRFSLQKRGPHDLARKWKLQIRAHLWKRGWPKCPFPRGKGKDGGPGNCSPSAKAGNWNEQITPASTRREGRRCRSPGDCPDELLGKQEGDSYGQSL
jgi:hypothetical protein